MNHLRVTVQYPTLAALTLLAVAAHAEGLVTVEQRIYGMDCAPCANGTQRALSKLTGVEAVTVSLNSGEATLQFADESPTTLAEIRAVIRKNGFTPKETIVTVAGELVRDGDRLVLATRKADRYVLEPGTGDAPWRALQAAANRAAVEVRGEVDLLAHADGLPRLKVTEYRSR